MPGFLLRLGLSARMLFEQAGQPIPPGGGIVVVDAVRVVSGLSSAVSVELEGELVLLLCK